MELNKFKKAEELIDEMKQLEYIINMFNNKCYSSIFSMEVIDVNTCNVINLPLSVQSDILSILETRLKTLQKEFNEL